jgi:Protein of unknown function (DUF4236)
VVNFFWIWNAGRGGGLMGLRLRRRISLFPGITLNLGKTGASVSSGVKGATVTLDKTGVRKTVGLPGTGLSYTDYENYGHTTDLRLSSPQVPAQAGISLRNDAHHHALPLPGVHPIPYPWITDKETPMQEVKHRVKQQK